MRRPSKNNLAGRIARCEEETGLHRDYRTQFALAQDLRKLKPGTLRWLFRLVKEREDYMKRKETAIIALQGALS